MNLTNQNLSNILTYMKAYADMLQAEEEYLALRNYGTQVAYTNATDRQNTARMQLYELIEPGEIVEILAQLKQISNEIVMDIKEEFFT